MCSSLHGLNMPDLVTRIRFFLTGAEQSILLTFSYIAYPL
jgi:hypothetical protein